MIKKFRFGQPVDTEAIVVPYQTSEGAVPYFDCNMQTLVFSYHLSKDDIVYGLGESNRGINKRGWKYVSNCSDDPNHTESKLSLYGAHNFLIIDGIETFGIFVDYPGRITFDIGAAVYDTLTIHPESPDFDLYIIEGTNPSDITKHFREMIGRPFLPPFWSFGYQQSRWGYRNEDDVRNVVDKYRTNGIPLDAVYLDIDYMTGYKDFTVDEKKFPDLKSLADDMHDEHIRLVPIIDAGVKIEDGYDIYEEGVKNGYFCKREDGSLFVAGVWPGRTHFPDVLNKEARRWFGDKYKLLIDQGIEGFWNDMNEPAIFYSDEGLAKLKTKISSFMDSELDVSSYFEMLDTVNGLSNQASDYKLFYHNIDGKKVRHDKVHNLFGYNMTRAAGEAFERICPDKRILLFSRSSYIGMHRYGGLWTGDNQSWWAHLLLNIKMMPSLNMCGFLYAGADLGGFGDHTTGDLLLRWLAFGLFAPLMRNHSASNTREQECFRFGMIEDFKHVVSTRYRLVPYIYSEYMKDAFNNECMFKPLAFEYPDDVIAAHTEDQVLYGDGLMLSPVYTQNAVGRTVYLPEDMLFIKFVRENNSECCCNNEADTACKCKTISLSDGSFITAEALGKGTHYIEVALNEVPLFIRRGHLLPICGAAQSTDELDTHKLDLVGYYADEAVYELYQDDGISRNVTFENNLHPISLADSDRAPLKTEWGLSFSSVQL